MVQTAAGATAARATSAGGRIVGVDIARGLAVLGMFAAHTIARGDVETIANGRSSVLFATLAGVSIGLMTTRPVREGTGRGAALVGIATRGALLFVLGSALWLLDSRIAIILDYYGIAFLLLLPLVFAPRAVIAVTAVAIAVVGPRITQALADTALTGDYLVDRLSTGYYPAVSWTAYLAAGLLCARLDLRRRGVQLGMLLVGGAVSATGYGAAALLPGVSAEAHSDTTAELLGSGGLAVAIIGLLLLVTAEIRGPLAAATRGIRLVAWPVAAVGAMPLTIYTAQILVLAVWEHRTPPPVDHPPELFLGLVVGALVLASAWRPLLGAGPLERALRVISRYPPSARPPGAAPPGAAPPSARPPAAA